MRFPPIGENSKKSICLIPVMFAIGKLALTVLSKFLIGFFRHSHFIKNVKNYFINLQGCCVKLYNQLKYKKLSFMAGIILK